jgi:hypothetical protein
MPNIDIPIPEDLKEALAAPKCIDLSFPPPKKLSIQMPTGAIMQVPADLSKNIPNDCSVTFSMLIQLQPVLMSMECILKMLKLLKVLADAVTSLPPTPAIIKDIVNAVADLSTCFLALTPAGLIPFIRDVLCLILRILRCLIGSMKSLIEIMSGLTIRLEFANATGNSELAETIKCAQGNAASAAALLSDAFGPVSGIMDLISPMMEMAGVSAIKMPALASASDMEGLQKAVTALEDVVETIQKVVDTLGGCPG